MTLQNISSAENLSSVNKPASSLSNNNILTPEEIRQRKIAAIKAQLGALEKSEQEEQIEKKRAEVKAETATSIDGKAVTEEGLQKLGQLAEKEAQQRRWGQVLPFASPWIL